MSLLLLSAALPAQQYIISTFAGGAPPPTPARGVDLKISYPFGVAMDAVGTVYFASDDAVFKLDQYGMVTRVAGNGHSGYAGDGGPATDAQFYGANGIAVDGAGNLFIADTVNHRVRRVSQNGIIATVAGDGTTTRSPLPVDGSPAAITPMNTPSNVAVDSAGNLYVIDSPFIRKISTAGIVTTVAGCAASCSSGFGDGGPAVKALLSPTAVILDGAGNLYIAENTGDRADVRKVSPNGIIAKLLAESGIAPRAWVTMDPPPRRPWPQGAWL